MKYLSDELINELCNIDRVQLATKLLRLIDLLGDYFLDEDQMDEVLKRLKLKKENIMEEEGELN